MTNEWKYGYRFKPNSDIQEKTWVAYVNIEKHQILGYVTLADPFGWKATTASGVSIGVYTDPDSAANAVEAYFRG